MGAYCREGNTLAGLHFRERAHTHPSPLSLFNHVVLQGLRYARENTNWN